MPALFVSALELLLIGARAFYSTATGCENRRTSGPAEASSELRSSQGHAKGTTEVPNVADQEPLASWLLPDFEGPRTARLNTLIFAHARFL